MLSRCVLTLILLLASLAARADTIATFDLTGISVFYGLAGNLNTVTGMTTINITTRVVQSISFTAGGIFQTGVDSQLGPIVFVGTSKAKISFDAGSLIGYNGSAFDLNGPNDLYVGHGTVVATAPTPEPSSLVLLATSLLGAAGVAKRRFASSSMTGS